MLRNSGATLITGATSGIGSAVVLDRSQIDESIIIHGRNHDQLQRLAKQINSNCDVHIWCRDFGNVDYLFDEFQTFLNKRSLFVSRYVHAAGKTEILPFRRFTLSKTLDIFNVNTFSTIEILRVLACKPYRDQLKSIVIISAFYSKFGDKGNAIYAASKGALNSMIKSLATEFPKSRYNNLLLGAVRTPMTEHLFSGDACHKNFDRYILGTGLPSNVVTAVNFLLHDELWMTGQEIYLDGGASIS